LWKWGKRMVLFSNKAECYGCGKCQAACTAGAIAMKEDEEGFWYPLISSDKCIDCRICRDACEAIHRMEKREGKFYAVRCHDEALLHKSTSGGAFSLIAEEILKEDGLICGACMDEKCRVIHRLSNQIDGMRKSKYVQSDIRHIYREMEEELKKGRKILFSGTPCQCQAMKDFFSTYEEQLLFVALICRGVQSPRLWEEYLGYLGKDTSVTFYDFRDKSYCNDAHSVVYQLENEKHLVPMNEDRFSRLYTKCLTLRPSCYTCEFCRTDLPFDFTIGDFWGIEKVFPEFADGKGTSLVIARGERAENIMGRMQDRAQVISCEEEDCIQPALKVPAKETILRKLLFRDLATVNENGHCNMELILKKYGA